MKSLLIFCLSLLSLSAFAQNNAIVKGRITNSKNGEPVSFATVNVWNTTIGTTADDAGNYILKGLKPGYVQLKISAVGFKSVITGEVLVTNAKSAVLDVSMEETSVSLNEVTVTANTFRRNVESPVSLSRVGIEEIEKSPGSNRDISKVIQSLPGVASVAAYRNDLIVRGGGPSENRFYLDGIEIPTINHFSTQGASGGPVGILNVDFLREVNFYSGAFPSSKGDALSSVLDFRMLDGNSEKAKYRLTLGASDLGLTVDGPLGKKTTYIVSARRSYLQLLFKFLKLPFLPTYNDAQLKVKTKIDDKNELTFIGLGAYDVSRLNTGIKNPDDNQRFILNSLPEYDQWNYTLGVVYKHYGKHGIDSWIASRSTFYNKAYKYENNNESLPEILSYSSTEMRNKVRYEHTQYNGGYQLSWGVNFGVNQYKNSTYRLDFRNDSKDTISFNTHVNPVEYGAFANVTKGYFNEKLTLSLGARIDGNSFSANMHNPIKQFSPRFSASYNFYKNLFFNFNVGRYYQAPALTIMGFGDKDGNLVNKETGLKFIQSDHIVAGFEYRPTEKDKLTLEGFYKYYKHYPYSILDSISLASKGADYGVFGNEAVVSIANGKAYGVELMYRSRDFFGFNLVSAYTLYWSKAESFNKTINSKWVPTSWDNRNIFSITGSRKFGRNWETGVKWRYIGGGPYTPYDLDKSSLIVAYEAIGGLYLDYAEYNKNRLSSYNQLDIRVDKTYYFNKWSLNFYVDIQNLLSAKVRNADRYVPEIDSNGKPIIDPNDPQRYILKVIEDSGSGSMVPTVGVIIDF